jgi:Tol biopolymer transport system component
VRRDATSDSRASGARSFGPLTGLLVFAIVFLAAASPAAAAPVALTLDSASNVSYQSAHVVGTLDPGDRSMFWGFQYSTDKINWLPVNRIYGGEVLANSGPNQIEGDLGGLQGGTHYFARAFAAYGLFDELFFSPEPYVEFTTLPVTPPTAVSIDPASEVSYATAKLSGKVERPSGNSDPAFDASCRFEYVTDQQFVADGFANPTNISCNPATVTAEGTEEPVEADLTDLTPGVTYHFRLNAFNAGGSDKLDGGTFTTLAVSTPGVVIDPVSSITGASAHFSGEINPELGAGPASLYDVQWHFECTPACPGGGSGVVAADNSWHVVSGDPALEPNTDYQVTLVTSNAGETANAGPVSFKTAAPAPLVQTLGAGGIGTGSAVLSARVNPLNSPVSYQFEWGVGQGSTYEHVAPASPQPLVAGNFFQAVTTPLVGLQTGTLYHFRVVATNTQTSEVSKGVDRTFVTAVTVGPRACPNESSRIGPSAGLPDCRAYEWVTPGLNNTNTILSGLPIEALADGSAVKYITFDAPADAKGSTINQPVVSRRGSGGWQTRSLGALSPEPAESFGSIAAEGLVSSDFSESLFYSSTPIGTNRLPGELNLYLRRADDTVVPITETGPKMPAAEQQFPYSVGFARASEDFSHIYYRSSVQQLPESPPGFENTYDWSEAGGVKLVGILPVEGSTPETPAPEGALLSEGSLPASSRDGELVLFRAVGLQSLYLRVGGEETVEVSSPEPSAPDPGPANNVRTVGITADGSKVLFTSSSELTSDANTGETGGVNNDQGADLYSYDVGSKALTDLTVDDEPEDSAVGANVRFVPYASKDGTTFYFIATGNLAPGAVSGEPNLYVLRDGEIHFVAPAIGMINGFGGGEPTLREFSGTADGRYAVFTSTENLTSYDSGGQPEVFKYSYETGSTECASCLPNGEPPSAGASIQGRAVSANGNQVFFTSSDPVLPGLSGGLARAYEYSEGQVSLLSPAEASVPVKVADASASGDDVFLITYEELVPGAGRNFAIYDAHVNADTFKAATPQCQGEACRGAGSSAPGSSATGSAQFEAPGEVTVPKSKEARAKALKLRMSVPESGQLTVSGKGIKTVKKSVSKAGPVTLTVTLTPAADKQRLDKGVFRTKARVKFEPSAGSQSRATGAKPVISLTFQGPIEKGGK